MKALILAAVLLFSGCTVKLCNCGTQEEGDIKVVDKDSTNVEFTLTPDR